MAELEEKDFFRQLSQDVFFGLPERAGCKNVINLHGSVYENYCPHCGKKNIRWNISVRQREFLFVRNVMHQFVQVCV